MGVEQYDRVRRDCGGAQRLLPLAAGVEELGLDALKRQTLLQRRGERLPPWNGGRAEGRGGSYQIPSIVSR
jgi:hypothetical protein